MVVTCLAALPAGGQEMAAFTVTGDAIEAPLGGRVGDAARGDRLVRNRETANCLICHAIPDPGEPFMGEVGPPLGGVALRLTPGQIRLRLVDPTRVDPAAAMPAYHRVADLAHVEERYRGKPVLSAQEIEDLVAYLSSLKE